MSVLLDRVRQTVLSPTGSGGPLTLNTTAFSLAHTTILSAGGTDNMEVSYVIEEGTDFEIQRGVWSLSANTLTRNTPVLSSISGTTGTTKMTLAGSATIRVIMEASDIGAFRGARTITGSTGTIANSDGGWAITFNRATAIAVSLAAPSGNSFRSGWQTLFKNIGAGLVTITATGATINGNATADVPAGFSGLMWSDGANYVLITMPVPFWDAAVTLTSAQKVQARTNIGILQTAAIGAVDLNTIVDPGTYYCTANPSANAPVSGTQFYIEVIVYGAPNFLMQRATNLLNPAETYVRTNFNGTWGAWRRQVDMPLAASLMRSYLAGLTLSAAGGTGTFGISAGVTTDSTNSDMMSLPSAFTKTNGAWSAGSGGGGLDTGGLTSVWYHVYVIKRPDTGAVDILFSLSATSPTLPTNYTLFRRIGAMFMKGTGFWAQFTQNGDEFLWYDVVNDIATSAQGTTPTLYTLASVPPGIKVEALLRGFGYSANAITTILISSPDENPVAVNTPNGNDTIQTPAANGAQGAIVTLRVRTNTSTQIRITSSQASTTIALATYGYIDPRGRNA